MSDPKGMKAWETYASSLSYIAEEAAQSHKKIPPQPFLTISRLTGTGSHGFGDAVADYMCEHDKKAKCTWTAFDDNLVDRVVEEHNIPQVMSKYLEEDKVSQVRLFINDLLGKSVSMPALIRKTAVTILNLAQAGDAIIIGRGGAVITREMKGGFHVRLVSSLESRVKHVQEHNNLSRADAQKFIQQEDKKRADYMREYYRKDIDDPLLYDAVLNLDHFSVERAVCLIGDELIRIRNALS